MLEERTIAANFVDHFQKKDREVDESLEKVRQLEKHWEAKPLATPKDNMKKAAELLKKKDEEIDINYVRKLVASAMRNRARQTLRAEISTVFHHRHPELRVLRYLLDVAVPPETPGPMG
ncbi:hypothetical protein QYE76_068303 [Lolium multiflorum]|uniref:Uncharacterized protein n=1 Tax=Lolium multiflorum TaxID=4521 RepID=A0AAD8SF92_LOLMU|nr:hypothetical protein QYE76_068303 [Lolium multiflorum]